MVSINSEADMQLDECVSETISASVKDNSQRRTRRKEKRKKRRIRGPRKALGRKQRLTVTLNKLKKELLLAKDGMESNREFIEKSQDKR